MKVIIERVSLDEWDKPCEDAIRISRQNGTFYWQIELDTMEDLIAFIDKHGGVILDKHEDNNEEYLLRIYDWYV